MKEGILITSDGKGDGPNQVAICDHCRGPLGLQGKTVACKENLFCCQGCATVFKLLGKLDLSQYYLLKEEGAPVGETDQFQQNYSYLNNQEIKDQYTQIKEGRRFVQFYIEGIHCIACLWLMERLPEVMPQVLQSHLIFDQKVLSLWLDKDCPLSEVAHLLHQFGYRPKIIESLDEGKKYKKKENKVHLTRLAVAGFCAGNIMLMAISHYAGVMGFWRHYFNWASLLLFLPILFYASIPFFKNSYYDIKKGHFSLDIPIVFALTLGSGLSIYHVITKNPLIYFDTLSIFVFLILASRYYLMRVQEYAEQLNNQANPLIQNEIVTLVGDQKKEVIIQSLLPGDQFYFMKGHTLAIEGHIVAGQAYIDNSFMTGESRPLFMEEGEILHSGCRNLTKDIIVEVDRPFDQSQIHHFYQKLKGDWLSENYYLGKSEKISTLILAAVGIVSIAALIFHLFNGTLGLGLNSILALLVITCPCVIGLGTPLILNFAMTNLAKQGIIVKSGNHLRQLGKIQNIVFDKTGTLTHGRPLLKKWVGEQTEDVLQAVYSLETLSSHPYARVMVQYIEKRGDIRLNDVQSFHEKLGIGVQGMIDGNLWSIEKDTESVESVVCIKKNGVLLAQLFFADIQKESALELITWLKSQGKKVFLLTGDKEKCALEIGKSCGFKEDEIFAEMMPQEKAWKIGELSPAIMIGDGMNDSLALSQAEIGIAFNGGIDLNKKAADIFMQESQLSGLKELFSVAHQTNSLTLRNIGIGLVYNMIAIPLAITGGIDPLKAAIIMPVISLFILASTFFSFNGNFKGAKR